VKPISTKFHNAFHLTNVNNRSQFGIDWQGSFGFGEVQKLPFPIETITALVLTTAALLRMQVMSTWAKCE